MAAVILGRAARRAQTLPWAQLMATQVRGMAAEADPFMDIFKKQQTTYRSLLEKTSTLEIPEKTDVKGIQAYATKLASIRKELGLYPSTEEYRKAVEAKEKALAAECDGSMRNYVEKLHTIGVDADVQNGMLAALDSVEAKLGRPMMQTGDTEGQKLYSAALDSVRKEHGIDKVSEKDLLAKADYEVAEMIVKDLHEMNAVEFFEAYSKK
eukprot:CAMPEP_0177768528 /NCGR_PEP_ID=MMETSP0491_2-20121128/9773_1 /TAXON_ID=63592 /ORGANISM="Tetraselmis chuii, Strain PLY429" /LENGTH=209 /DNA_ID=CAMNT_0019285349 /DNA_START=133 /DNA_END=762 /DNA_ORIENTATION=+